MKVFSVVFLLLVACETHGLDRQVRSWFALKSLLYSSDPQFGCDPGQKGFTCKDCKTMVRCDTAKSYECATVNPATPYCNPVSKECQAANTCESSDSPAMDCKYRGFFPDPINCRYYSFCSSAGTKSQSYSCPTGYMFDSSRKVCAATATCVTFNSSDAKGLCKGKMFKYVTHTTDSSLYMLCDEEYKLESCPSPHQKFNVSSEQCEFACKYEGFFANPDDETTFYTCVKSGTVLKAVEQKCAAGAKFDMEIDFCVAALLPITTGAPTTITA